MTLISSIVIMTGLGLIMISPVYAKTVDLTDANFDEEISKQPSFVMFFTTWCGHCQRAKPEWASLAETFANQNNILIGSVDCEAQKDTAKKYEISGFPTIKFFKDGTSTVYEGGRTADDFVEFANKETGLNLKVKKPIDPIRDLDSVSFKSDVEIFKKNYFVVFYASWCGHCKTLMPLLPKLMDAFIGDDTIEVVKVDANQHSEIGEKYEVQGYPTLKLFLADDQTPVPYDSAREPQDMLAFINKHVGTHRTLEGGFDTGAWPSDTIKDLVQQFRKADKVEKTEIVEKTKQATESVTGRFAKYAHFYPKLMKKVVGNPKFLDTEPDRLEKLLQSKMGEEPKLNALYRIAILKQLKGVVEPTVETTSDDDDKDEL